MTDTATLTEWTPIQHAGPSSGPIELMARNQFIMRLQDGLLIARAKRVVRRQARCAKSGEPSLDGAALTYETDVILPAELWSSDRLGFFDRGFWTDGEHRQVDDATIGDDYDGDHTTYYGIELREALDLTGHRAGYEEAVSWCVEWFAKQRSAGLPTGEKVAWPEFKTVERHIGLSRDDVFRPAFRAAKSGKN